VGGIVQTGDMGIEGKDKLNFPRREREFFAIHFRERKFVPIHFVSDSG
jgi:hypothetical protein